jgi:uncharacterized membrane protein
MNNKKILIGGIAGGILFFLLGWLVYGILLVDFMNQHAGLKGNVNRSDTDMQMGYILAGSILQGVMLAYVLVKANINNIAAGLITGVVIGFLISTSYDLTMYGTTYILSKKAIMADIIGATLISAMVSAVIVFIINKIKK